MEDLLINAGLTPLQAQAYLFLLREGPSAPRALPGKLKITRTNAYKVLESLESLDLVRRDEKGKKIVYSPADPSSLTSLIAEKRNAVIALEHNINLVISELRKSYDKQNARVKIEQGYGKGSLEQAYLKQAKAGQPIYFVKSRADLPFMGFEAMDRIRKDQGKTAPKRYGITPDSPEGPLDAAIDARTGLTRTWIDDDKYVAPVEWSVSGNMLLIQVFEGEGSSIIINNRSVARAFEEVWNLAATSLRESPNYKGKPRKAKRAI